MLCIIVQLDISTRLAPPSNNNHLSSHEKKNIIKKKEKENTNMGNLGHFSYFIIFLSI